MTNRVSRRTALDRTIGTRATLLEEGVTNQVPPAEVTDRVLTEAIVASADVPPHDRATMDGYAFAAADGYPLRVVGDIGAEGEPPKIETGEAIRIATGASLPDRADAVLERERAELEEENGETTLSGPSVEPGRNVFRRGTTAKRDETLFSAGDRLTPPDSGLLADIGVADVPVREPFSVRILGTGTELVEGRQPDRDSPMLANLVASWGHERQVVAPVPDEPDAVRDTIAEHAAASDVLLTSGGTGGGARDHVRSALADLGEIVVDGIDARPGSHVRVATLPDHDAVAVALPGKPVAAFLSAISVCRALLTAETAEPTERARLGCDLAVPDREAEFVVPVEHRGDELVPLGHADSSVPIYGERFSPRILADCARVLEMDGYLRVRESLDVGETVRFVPMEVVT
ncbi:molybdopterin-binding protein [Haladaptatus sp. AB643]|uniref:molybdopterin molybdotransferase MoeA n=1 Tax=Haladaptatus sp. AB643 TaxID=2934174 RepID=UPI00209C4AA3|nr:molybdopterin-binding protein [Haladaptatus sp. AB643]